MSALTRPIYDKDAIPCQNKRNTSIMEYAFNPDKYYNCNQCSNEFGLFAGNDVSIVNKNMVDLESQFKGLTPTSNNKNLFNKSNTVHLNTCKIIDYGNKVNFEKPKMNPFPTCAVNQYNSSTVKTPLQNVKPLESSRYTNANTWN